MITVTTTQRVDCKNGTSDDTDLLNALDALEPGEQSQKIAMFAKAYPGILRAIARKVPQKDILAALGRSGLKLHPIRYRTMLEAERKLRNEHGEPICCEVCGSVLQLPQSSESPSDLERLKQSDQPNDNGQPST